jgi:hypothetical protein
MNSPLAYWIIVKPRADQRPEVKSLCDWLVEQSRITRQLTGEVPRERTIDRG